jgi:hypothetical protein
VQRQPGSAARCAAALQPHRRPRAPLVQQRLLRAGVPADLGDQGGKQRRLRRRRDRSDPDGGPAR